MVREGGSLCDVKLHNISESEDRPRDEPLGVNINSL